MLTRGVKYIFKTGENVLSFEPDSSKAKVLYNAKVLDCLVTRDRRAHRKPAYLIHFQGWNNSWDRVVPESFLLKNTEDNRNLMHKLSSISTRVKRNSVRIRKIDHALRKHFQRRTPGGGADMHTDSESDTDSEGEGSRVSSKANSEGGREEDNSSGDEADSEQEGNKSSNDNSSDEEEEERIGEAVQVKLELPETIKQKLIQDYDLINKQKKLLALPASQNVITILENYVKTLAMSQLYESAEKQRNHRLRSQQLHNPEKSIELCKEMVDGLRIIFDFTLPIILLYDIEREQYHSVINHYHPTQTMHQLVSINETAVDSTCDSSSDEVSFRTPPQTGLPTLKTPPHTGLPTLRTPPPLRRQTSPEVPSERRVTRLSSSGAVASDPPPPVIVNCSSKQFESTGDKKRRASLNPFHTAPNLSRFAHQVGVEVEQGGGRHSRTHAGEGSSKSGEILVKSGEVYGKSGEKFGNLEEGHSKSGEGRSRKRKSVAGGKSPSHDVTGSPNPRKSRLASLSSVASSSLTVSGLLHDAKQELLKEKVMRDVESWRLVPSHVYSGEAGSYQVQPSVVYGAHHLVRMFVELPDILSRMRIPSEKRRHLIKQLEMFLEYLGNHSEELLPTTGCYIKTEELLPTLAKIKKSQ